jgi:hypothetical protein
MTVRLGSRLCSWPWALRSLWDTCQWEAVLAGLGVHAAPPTQRTKLKVAADGSSKQFALIGNRECMPGGLQPASGCLCVDAAAGRPTSSAPTCDILVANQPLLG